MIFNPKPMCGHTSTHIANAKAATCGANGYTGDTVCDNCGEILSKGSVISATGNHQYTSSQSGSTITYTCKVCGHKYTQQVPKVTITVHGSITGNYGFIRASCDGKNLQLGDTVQVTRGSTLDCMAMNQYGTSQISGMGGTVNGVARQTIHASCNVDHNAELSMYMDSQRTQVTFSDVY